MDVIWLITGILLMLVGLAGCILPFLPGPPICYAALFIQQFQSSPPYTKEFLLTWAIITAVITGLDYIIPLYGTKKFGGTRYGMWGCVFGLVVGLWMGPLGLIIGPFLGAFIGELIGNANSDHALKAALGSFVGFVFGTLLKLVICFVMGWYFIQAF